MMKVPPIMFTVPPWIILVDNAAACGGCVSVVGWLPVGCCG